MSEVSIKDQNENGTPLSELRAKLGEPYHFDGNPNSAATTQIMDKLNQGDISRAICIANRTVCLGVNFWPQCNVISLFHPLTMTELD